MQLCHQWAAVLLTAGIATTIFHLLSSAVQQRAEKMINLLRKTFPSRYSGKEQSQVAGDQHYLEAGPATIPKRWSSTLRGVWYMCAGIAWGNFLLSIPVRVIALDKDLSTRLEPSLLLPALEITNVLVLSAVALISLVMAVILFIKRQKDRMGLFLSFFLLVYSFIVAGPLLFLEPYLPGIREFGYNVIQASIFAPLLVVFLSIFPNGRFVPSWTRRLVMISIFFALISPFLFNSSDTPFLAIANILGVMLWFGLLLCGIYAQVKRYRYISNTTERQQTKWVLYGFSLQVMLAFLLSAGTINIIPFPQDIAGTWLNTFAGLGWSLAFAPLPIALTFAVMRYRLYAIDFLINRTLVYGVLTGSVIALYAITVGAVGILFQSGGNMLLALVVTGLVAVLFQPLRARLQRGVNRMMYGERDEPFTVLSHLGQRLESSGMPEDNLVAIVETVTQALKLPYAEITVIRGHGFERVAWRGKQVDELISFPIQYQGQTIGYLKAALRGPGESLAAPDEGLLRQIARQTGPIAQSVQLTRDLRRSRARLVTAREEERRRLRRDLHDGLGPVLASQGLKIAAVSRMLDIDRDAAHELLAEVASQNEATVGEIRRLVYALRPPELDELGLVGALCEYAAGLDLPTGIGSGLAIDVQQLDGDWPDLPAAVEVAAYRIATEALTNVTRHAQARHCTIIFSREEKGEIDVLKMVISDDGRGLPVDRKAGIGLASMRERAEEVNGEFYIESVTNQGTTIVAVFPLKD